ncbi:Magnesium transporter MRS2-3 [Raphanus sativus]|nr:Magnesium transporter MRS2-3 [Raphanus sativus]
MRGPRPEDFDSSASHPTPTFPAGGSRKKGMGVRTWLVLCSSGKEQATEAGKHTIMRRTGLPARDLRILDPLLSYPSTVLGRERAIVINLEHIKAIITAQEVLILNSKDPSVVPFIEELQRRIRCHHHATKPQEGENTEGAAQGEAGTSQLSRDQGEEAKKDKMQSLGNQDGSKAVRLELEAHPAMDKLTIKISTLNLERVRQIKSRLVAITGRVQKVRDALEHLLDDDEDMAEMYLTDKLALPEGDEDDRFRAEVSPESCHRGSDAHNLLMRAHSALSRNSRGTSSSQSGMTNKLNVQELEMLLEAYFVQIDGTLNKLSTLREYVDDTEDYINIMLDGKQNNLLQMGVQLTTATLVMSLFIAVAGVFGMNITIELFNDNVAGPGRFMWTVIGGTAGSLFLYFGAIGWYKQKRLLE